MRVLVVHQVLLQLSLLPHLTLMMPDPISLNTVPVPIPLPQESKFTLQSQVNLTNICLEHLWLHLLAAGLASYITTEMQKQGELLKINPDKIEPIKSVVAPSVATRPTNSQLSTQKIQNSFNIYLPPWQKHVVRMIKEMCTKK